MLRWVYMQYKHPNVSGVLQAMLGIAALFWNAYIGPSSLAPLS